MYKLFYTYLTQYVFTATRGHSKWLCKQPLITVFNIMFFVVWIKATCFNSCGLDFSCDIDQICGFLGNYAALSGNSLPKFWDHLSVPSSIDKKWKTKASNTWYTIYIGKVLGGDWFSVSVMPAKKVDAVW